MSVYSLWGTASQSREFAPLTVARGSSVSREDFLARVWRVHDWLVVQQREEVAIVTERREDALVALVAALGAGKQALLLPASQRSVFPDLPQLSSFVPSAPSRAPGLALAELPGVDEGPAPPFRHRLEALVAEQVVASVVTSGTSGAPGRHQKTAGQLLGEVALWVDLLGWGVDDVVLATVPGHHLYGLLFSLLLPLASGAPLIVDPRAEADAFHPRAVADLARELGATRLVTVPAHLRTLLDADVELGSLRQVICSGAALDGEWARRFEARFGVEVVDVLGSTETGGIARRRPAAGPAWDSLPGVQVRADAEGGLLLRSPFAPPGVGEFSNGDRVQLLEDGRFEHLGRSDGIVKVGGKRISLQEIEQCMRRHPGVRDAVARARAVGGLRGQEISLLVESDDLDAETVRAHLARELDPVFLPRRLRVLRQLPRSERGKLEQQAFEAAFEVTAAGQSRQVNLCVPADSPRFRGHFPGEPVYPAVAQLLDWVLPELRALCGERELAKLTRLRFTGKIAPDQELTLRLERNGPDKISFDLREGERGISSGSLSLRPVHH